MCNIVIPIKKEHVEFLSFTRLVSFLVRYSIVLQLKLVLILVPFLFGLLFNSALASEDFVFVYEQVQIVSDLSNGQDKPQSFAYLVQIKDADGVTVSLAWITGSLSPNQHLSPSLSWTPQNAGIFVAEIFVWESITNPDPLSAPQYLEIEVRDPTS